MNKRTRRIFSSEFKLEAAQLILDQHYSVTDAVKAMYDGKSTMDKWVRLLKKEHYGISPRASTITSENIEI